MVNQAEEPLTRVTINLFEADVEYIKRNIGSGWSQAIRELVREAINDHRRNHERNS